MGRTPRRGGHQRNRPTAAGRTSLNFSSFTGNSGPGTMNNRGRHARRKAAGGHHGAECGRHERFGHRFGRRARIGRAIVPQRAPALPRPRDLSLRDQRRDSRRLVDRPSARLLLVRQPVRSQARRRRAKHGSGAYARRPVVLVQAAGVDVGGAVAGHARLLSLADARHRPPGRLGDCPDGRGADHGRAVGLHHRPRDGPPAVGGRTNSASPR